MGKEVLMEFDYMYKNDICTHVVVYKGGEVSVVDYTDKIPLRAFGVWGSNAKFCDVINLFEIRCLPETRHKIGEMLGGRNFSAEWIIKNINHGVMACDCSWIRFSYENDLTWEKVSEILRFKG